MKSQPECSGHPNINLMISLLSRFPEIFTIHYNSATSTFRLNFLLKEKISKEDYHSFKDIFNESFAVFEELQRAAGGMVSRPSLSRKDIYHFTFLLVTWKKQDLSMEEVNLARGLILPRFKDILFFDLEFRYFQDNYQQDEEDSFAYLMQRGNKKEDSYLAFREAGKVYVFDK